MTITIEKQLRSLRKAKGNTQQELADHLGISVQAVSKWERGEGCPDIGTLPLLAAYYHVTVDTLLGTDRISRQRRLDDYRVRLGEAGRDAESRLSLARAAYREMADEPEAVHWLCFALYDDGPEQHAEELERLSKWLLKHANQTGQYFGAVRHLCYLSAQRGDWQEAKRYAAMGGRYIGTETQLLIHALDGEEAAAMCRWNLEMLANLIGTNTRVLLEKGTMAPQERALAAQRAAGVFALFGMTEKAEYWTQIAHSEQADPGASA